MSSLGASSAEKNCENFIQLSEEQILVALPFGQRLYVKGKVKLCTILLNQIEIQGYTFNVQQQINKNVWFKCSVLIEMSCRPF